MDVEYKIYLVEKFLNHSLTEQEEKEFQLWLDEDDRNKDLIERLQKNRGIQERMDYFQRVDEEKGWAEIKCQCEFKKEKWLFLRKAVRYAAMIAVIAGAYWLLLNREYQKVELADAGKTELQNAETRVVVELANGERLALGDSLDLKQGEFEGGKFAEARDGLMEMKREYAALELEYDLLRYRYLETLAWYYDAKSDLSEVQGNGAESCRYFEKMDATLGQAIALKQQLEERGVKVD